jgi:hypothetical protein
MTSLLHWCWLFKGRGIDGPSSIKLLFVSDAGLFALLVSCHLFPIWWFRYIPTQDGPSHLANAVMLRYYHDAPSNYSRAFRIRPDPVPNWTSHALLAVLIHLVPPLVAEKLLASLYIMGISYAYWYYLRSFGLRGLLPPSLGLLFLYNRCFLTGFYNFSLSLILFWATLGLAIRRREALSRIDTLLFGALFLLGFFTHVFGYLLMLGAVTWVFLLTPKRLRNLSQLTLAALPSLILITWYWQRVSFWQMRSEDGAGIHPLISYALHLTWNDVVNTVSSINDHWFGAYDLGVVPLLELVLCFFGALPLLSSPTSAPFEDRSSSHFRGLGLIFCLCALYVLMPNWLRPNGGFVKARVAVVLPMLVVPFFRFTHSPVTRRILMGILTCVLALNLILVTLYFHRWTGTLEEFTAGVESVERQAVLFVVYSGEHFPIVDPLDHAGGYYSLRPGVLNLDNYEATNHFPIMWQSGVTRGRNEFNTYPNRDLVDTILLWEVEPKEFVETCIIPFHVVMQKGRMALLRRREACQD